MAPAPLHADEIVVSEVDVARLIASQFPQWSALPVRRQATSGTDHAIYRLGDHMAVRLPRRAAAAAQAEKEQVWLPHLAPHIPFPIYRPLAAGAPGVGYPWVWSVCDWIEGEVAQAGSFDPAALAKDIAAFIRALRAIDATGGPAPGRHNFGRGVALARRDDLTGKALAECDGLIDVAAAKAAWAVDMAAPTWTEPPVWIHGDLCPGNLLVSQGRLAAVIDFGGLAVGDPACDLIAAWNLLPPSARPTFREALAVDDATWARGRAWALSVAVVQLPYYQHTNPDLVANSRLVIDAVLADHAA